MPITIIFSAVLCAAASFTLDGGPAGKARTIIIDTAATSSAVRFNCIASHGGRKAGIAHVGGCGMAQQTIRGDHRSAAQVPMKVLSENARHAVKGYRIGARVEEAVEMESMF